MKLRRRRDAALAVAALLIVGAGGGYLLSRTGSNDDDSVKRPPPGPCVDVPATIMQRVRRGYVPGRSGDVLAVERLPNQFNTRHSTPWPYTQDVPLVLYGPGFISSGITSERYVTLADIAPTFAELLNFDGLGPRDGRPLADALLPEDRRNGVPRLIMTVVWDGGGDNMLARWPDSWPNLKRLMREGTTYDNATVGSSPSITPTIHATLGSGDFPARHGLPDTRMRVKGEMVDAWDDKSPRYLRTETLADLWDRANGNRPKVGLLARDAWHLGMIGHGSFVEGGDKDIAVLDALGSLQFTSNESYYTLPDYATTFDGLAGAVEEVDLRDGKADGTWLGNAISSTDGQIRETPAWSIFQTQKIKQILENEGFGRDEVPDLFFTNYKSTDLAGHTWNVVEPEVRDDLEQQDHELGLLIDELDRLVGRDNYVLALTADHGVTPYPEVTGGWSIQMTDLSADIERAFDHMDNDVPILLSNRGYQFFLNKRELAANDATPEDIAAFIRNYRLRDNVTSSNELTPAYEDRLDERLYLTAITPQELATPRCGGP